MKETLTRRKKIAQLGNKVEVERKKLEKKVK